jgi:abortive infection bacteriophage resistance protein
LSAYWHPFKRPDESFAPDTTLDKVWRRYTFDRHLRLLVMDAIERVEVAVLRTLMVEHHARKYGPFGYRDARNFHPEFAGLDHQRMVDEISPTLRSELQTDRHWKRRKRQRRVLLLGGGLAGPGVLKVLEAHRSRFK